MKKKLILVIAALLIALTAVSAWLIQSSQKPAIIKDTSYKTVLPAGSSIESLGGWKMSKPVDSETLYSYDDKINDTTVRVTQQLAPANMNLSEVAKNFNATEVVKMINGSEIYLGTSVKGPQYAIFAMDNLLIFIKSENKLDNQSWLDYIQSLN
jgi:hypothetical protein